LITVAKDIMLAGQHADCDNFFAFFFHQLYLGPGIAFSATFDIFTVSDSMIFTPNEQLQH
jgi:hypothetical protein